MANFPLPLVVCIRSFETKFLFIIFWFFFKIVCIIMFFVRVLFVPVSGWIDVDRIRRLALILFILPFSQRFNFGCWLVSLAFRVSPVSVLYGVISISLELKGRRILRKPVMVRFFLRKRGQFWWVVILPYAPYLFLFSSDWGFNSGFLLPSIDIDSVPIALSVFPRVKHTGF